MKILVTAVMVIAALVVFQGSALALNLGANITIPDLVGTGSGWWGAQEDQEVEPNCLSGQIWDLEGFFLQGNTLSMVGGYNFVLGEGGYGSGDIFIDTDGNVNYGTFAYGTGYGNGPVPNSLFGYEYVLDLDLAAKTYNVYALGNDTLLDVWYAQNQAANPWQFVADRNPNNAAVDSGTIGYQTNQTDAAVGGLLGGFHNVASVSLAFLPAGTEFISHFTYRCGNDNLMGSGTTNIPDGGMTAMLLGFALLTVEGIRRKIRK